MLDLKNKHLTNESQIFAQLWQIFCNSYNQAISDKEEFNLMLSGGNTPLRFYDYVFKYEDVNRINWQKVNIFFSDERHVAMNSVENNANQAKEFFLDKLNCKRIFPFNTDIDPQSSALDMKKIVKQHFELKTHQLPIFDLCFLGFGEDGHFASIFPDTIHDLENNHEICYASYIKKLAMYRLTFSINVFNKANRVVFIVNSDKKNEIYKKLWKRDKKLPIDFLSTTQNIDWLILNN